MHCRQSCNAHSDSVASNVNDPSLLRHAPPHSVNGRCSNKRRQSPMFHERASQKGPSRVPKSCVLLNLLDPEPAACQMISLWATAGPYVPPAATDRSSLFVKVLENPLLHASEPREELLSPPARVRVAARLASRTYRNLPIKENFPPWRGTKVRPCTHLDTGGVPTSSYGPRQQDKPFLETERSIPYVVLHQAAERESTVSGAVAGEAWHVAAWADNTTRCGCEIAT